jgi:hypothetical protein
MPNFAAGRMVGGFRRRASRLSWCVGAAKQQQKEQNSCHYYRTGREWRPMAPDSWLFVNGF